MIEIRSCPAPFSVRVSDVDQRTVVGIAALFNELNEIDGWEGHFLERIHPGAFKRTIRERGKKKIKLHEQHDLRTFPLGIATLLEERDAGLYVEFKLANTPAADDALVLVREDVVTGFSIGFEAMSEKWTKKHVKLGLKVRELYEIKLREISLTAYPALAGATVTGSRTIPPRRSYRARLNDLKGLS